MKKKIFFGIFLTSLIISAGASLLTSAVIFLDIAENWQDIAVDILDSIFLIIIAIVLVSAIAGFIATKRIVKPIVRIDPDHPEPKKNYRELAPILERLNSRNGMVNRQKAELISRREQFSLLTESMKEGMIIADPKTSILTCNSEVSKLLCVEPPKNGDSIFTLSREENFRRCIQDAMGGRRAECLLKTEQGDRRVIASPACINGAVNGIIVFIFDVTEEQALERMRREFTANVSHELKTPLTTIYGVADMLANGMVKGEDVTAFGSNIRREADRLITLINDIVALSKLDENSLPRSNEEVDLYELAEEIVCRLENCADEKNITGTVIGDHVTLVGNRTVLDEVIYNLCDNAIKYGNIGGKYEVKLSHIPKRAILTVSDNGIGISDEHIERIFERFYRVDKSRSRKIKGTGLGLSIVKHGVMYHGGTVRAVNTTEGTSFIAEFPL